MTCWADVIGVEKEQAYFKQTLAFVRQEREAGKLIYPPAADVFNAFKYTEFDQVRVVILGQDPYHGPRQAHGLCFSVQPGVATPPSLVNIYKELARDIPGFQIPSHGYLVAATSIRLKAASRSRTIPIAAATATLSVVRSCMSRRPSGWP